MNLRPNAKQVTEVKEVLSLEISNTNGYVKTSVTLSRDLAAKVKVYVHEQQLLYTKGERANHYSFSQFFNDALQHYLEYLEKGDSHENPRHITD